MDRVYYPNPASSPGIRFIVEPSTHGARKGMASILVRAGAAGYPIPAHRQELSPLALERVVRCCFSTCAQDLSKKGT